MARDLAGALGHGMTRKGKTKQIGVRRIHHRGHRGHEGFLGLARVVGHGMTRKSTEMEDRRIGARGLTRRREEREGFLGMARVVGHGMTRKSTEMEDRRIGARGLTRRREGFLGDGARRGPRSDTEIHGK
jgi:hypothetical protein